MGLAVFVRRVCIWRRDKDKEREYGIYVYIGYCLEVEDYRVCFGGEIDIGLDIITVFRVLFIFNNFIFINNVDLENCGSFKRFGFICRARLVSSEFFHWTRWILDTCLLLDTCPNLAVSNEKIHWTETLPLYIYIYIYIYRLEWQVTTRGSRRYGL